MKKLGKSATSSLVSRIERGGFRFNDGKTTEIKVCKVSDFDIIGDFIEMINRWGAKATQYESVFMVHNCKVFL